MKFMRFATTLTLCSILGAGGCGILDDPERKLVEAEEDLAKGRYGESVVALRNVLEDRPSDGNVRLLLARALMQQADWVSADRELRSAVAQGADALSAEKAQAYLWIQKGEFQALLERTESESTALDEDARRYYRARALLGLRRVAEALPIFLELAGKDQQNADLRLRIAQSHAYHGRNGLAQAALDESMSLPARSPAVSAEGWILQSLLSARAGDPAASEEAVRKAIESAPGELNALEHAQLLSRSITTALNAGLLEEAANYQSDLARLLPGSPLARMTKAQLQLFGEQAPAGVAELQRLLQEQHGTPAVRGLLVAGLLRTASLEQALREATSLAAAIPEAQELAAVRDAIRAASAEPAGSISRDLATVRALLGMQQQGLARQVVAASISREPDSVVLRAALGRVDLLSGQSQRALEIAQSLAREHPGDAAIAAFLAEAQVRAGDQTGAAATYQALWDAEANAGRAIALAQARREAGLPGVTQPLETWLASHPRDVVVRLELGVARQQAGDRASAEREFQRALADLPAGHPLRPVALNNLALLVGDRDPDRGLPLVREASEAAPGVPAIQDTLGWLLSRTGKPHEGLPLLRSASEAIPESAEIRYHYAAALARSGQGAAARELLTDVLLDPAPFEGRQDAVRLLAELR